MMKNVLFPRRNGLLLFGVVALSGLMLTSCDEDDPVGTPDTPDYSVYLSDFSEKVAVATYDDMKQKGAALDAAVKAFVAAPDNQTLLNAAAQAWVDMRAPWEKSEAFLFGPADFLSLDPSLDSWPVDRQQLNVVLAGSDELTPQFVAQALGPALRGFHTVEFLLFEEGSQRNVNDFTDRELEYLAAATEVLANDAATLADAWSNGFAAEFAAAGTSDSRYTNQTDAMLEIVDGMVGILDEVANGKIAAPYDEKDTRLVESQFSWNSLTDFQNNIRSVQNAYFGDYGSETEGKGLNEFVAEKDAALAARLEAEIQTAIDAIGQIPHPFRDNLAADAQITAAQEAILTVAVTLQQDVAPLFTTN